MRNLFILILLGAFCAAYATIKDPRELHPVAPLTQEEVARQQALQRGQAEIGTVPQKTDDTGYVQGDQSDPAAAAALANHATSADSPSDTAQAFRDNADVMSADANQPKKMAFGAFWAILAGLLLAGAAWAGLQKFGPKPPEHVLRQS